MSTASSSDRRDARRLVSIDDVVSERVALVDSGGGLLEGVCPFHSGGDSGRTLKVRSGSGWWYCMDCGTGGDVVDFITQADGYDVDDAIDVLTTFHGTSAGEGKAKTMTGRILEANATAGSFFVSQLSSDEGKVGWDFLKSRGLSGPHAKAFGVGYAPRGWTNVLEHLRKNGFTEDEIEQSGLVSRGERGLYDRFRGRVVWPIRSASGVTLGFGARKVHDDDDGPKYLNTPETAVYKKSRVLFGLDLARSSISKWSQVVVVEGYTDVMACHLAGVTNVVAACGTAFGESHVRMVRSLVGGSSGEAVFAFDGDEAGMKAAYRVFGLQHLFKDQVSAVVFPAGADPCDVWQKSGKDGLLNAMKERTLLVDVVLDSVLDSPDLETVEGRVYATRVAGKVVASIKDPVDQQVRVRRVASVIGVEMGDVWAEVRSDVHHRDPTRPGHGDQDTEVTRQVRTELAALGSVLQHPVDLGVAIDAGLGPDAFTVDAHKRVWDEIDLYQRTVDVSEDADWPGVIFDGLGDDESRRVALNCLVDRLPQPAGSVSSRFIQDVSQWLVRRAEDRDVPDPDEEVSSSSVSDVEMHCQDRAPSPTL